jgi:U3 small nucleolar RNA-associated protein 13
MASKQWKVQQTLLPLYAGGVPKHTPDNIYLVTWTDSGINLIHTMQPHVVLFRLDAPLDPIIAYDIDSSTPHDAPYAIVTAHQSGLVKYWNNDTLVKQWKAHELPISDIIFDPSGTLVATASIDKSVRIWDVKQAYCTHSFKAHSHFIDYIAFHSHISTSFAKIYVGTRDGVIKCWNLLSKKAEELGNGKGGTHVSGISSIVVCADLGIILSLGKDKVINLWNIESNDLLKTFPVYDELKFIARVKSADIGDFFISGSSVGALKTWKLSISSTQGNLNLKLVDQYNYSRDRIISLRSEEIFLPGITHLSFLSVLKKIVISTEDYNILILDCSADLSTNSICFKCEKMLLGFNEEIHDLKLLNATKFVAFYNSNQVRLLNIETLDSYILMSHVDDLSALDVSYCGKYLACCSKDSTLSVWSIKHEKDGKLLFEFLAHGIGHSESVVQVKFSKNLDLATASLDRTIKLWDFKKALNSAGNLICTNSTIAHQKDINCIQFSPNSSILASASQDKSIKFWKVPDLSLQSTLTGHKRGVKDVCFSDIEKVLVSASSDKTVKLWSIQTSACLKTFEGHTMSVLRAEVISSGTQIISAGTDSTIRLWNMKSNECINCFSEGLNEKVTTMCLAADRSFMVTATQDSEIQIWKDVTIEEQIIQESERSAHLLREQELQNLIRSNSYQRAFLLALQLDHPRRLQQILESIILQSERENEDLKTNLRNLLSNFTLDENLKCLNLIRDWNIHQKRYFPAQILLHQILCDDVFFNLKNLKAEQFSQLKSIIESLHSYTERHFKRVAVLNQQICLLDFVLAPSLQHGRKREEDNLGPSNKKLRT